MNLLARAWHGHITSCYYGGKSSKANLATAIIIALPGLKQNVERELLPTQSQRITVKGTCYLGGLGGLDEVCNATKVLSPKLEKFMTMGGNTLS